MGTALSPKVYEIVEKHLSSGIPLKDMNLAADQKCRVRVVLDLYKAFSVNEMMDCKQWLRRKYGRSEAEIRNDLLLLNFIITLMESGTKELSRFRVKRTAEKLISIGQTQGEWKTMAKGAELLYKVEGLDQDDTAEDVEATTQMLPIVVGGDVQRIDPNRTTHSPEQLEALRRKYGGAKDKTQEMVEAKMGLFVPAGTVLDEMELYEEEDSPDSFDSLMAAPWEEKEKEV